MSKVHNSQKKIIKCWRTPDTLVEEKNCIALSFHSCSFIFFVQTFSSFVLHSIVVLYVCRFSFQPSGWKHFDHIIVLLSTDVNECEVYKKDSGLLCAHMCVNIPGSYHCSCPSGYNLLADGRSCEGKWHLCLFVCTRMLRKKRKMSGEAWYYCLFWGYYAFSVTLSHLLLLNVRFII